MSKSGGGNQTKKQLVLVFIVMFTLFVNMDLSAAGTVAAVVLFCAVLVAVFHNGVQLFDFIVAFLLGCFCVSSYVGQGANTVISQVAGWVSQVVS